jgi:uncharacterized coiled-coil protein SlyX
LDAHAFGAPRQPVALFQKSLFKRALFCVVRCHHSAARRYLHLTAFIATPRAHLTRRFWPVNNCVLQEKNIMNACEHAAVSREMPFNSIEAFSWSTRFACRRQRVESPLTKTDSQLSLAAFRTRFCTTSCRSPHANTRRQVVECCDARPSNQSLAGTSSCLASWVLDAPFALLVQRFDRSRRELRDGFGQRLQEILRSEHRVTNLMGEISAASQEQTAGIEQINRAIAQMDQVTQKNAALVEDPPPLRNRCRASLASCQRWSACSNCEPPDLPSQSGSGLRAWAFLAVSERRVTTPRI